MFFFDGFNTWSWGQPLGLAVFSCQAPTLLANPHPSPPSGRHEQGLGIEIAQGRQTPDASTRFRETMKNPLQPSNTWLNLLHYITLVGLACMLSSKSLPKRHTASHLHPTPTSLGSPGNPCLPGGGNSHRPGVARAAAAFAWANHRGLRGKPRRS